MFVFFFLHVVSPLKGTSAEEKKPNLLSHKIVQSKKAPENHLIRNTHCTKLVYISEALVIMLPSAACNEDILNN